MHDNNNNNVLNPIASFKKKKKKFTPYFTLRIPVPGNQRDADG